MILSRRAVAPLAAHVHTLWAAVLFGGVLAQLRNRTVSLEDPCGPTARALHDDLRASAGLPARLLGRTEDRHHRPAAARPVGHDDPPARARLRRDGPRRGRGGRLERAVLSHRRDPDARALHSGASGAFAEVRP